MECSSVMESVVPVVHCVLMCNDECSDAAWCDVVMLWSIAM